MSEETEFMEFIQECRESGKGTTPSDIDKETLVRIQEIDHQLLEADKLRLVKAKLLRIRKMFALEAPKSHRRQVPILNEESTQDELDSKLLDHAKLISNHIEKNGPSSIRELMTVCSVTPDCDYEVYSVVKWLCSAGICIRTVPDRNLDKGPSWNSRPKN